jgi:hypothetical protein
MVFRTPTNSEQVETWGKGRLILLKSTLQDDGGYLTVQTARQETRNSSLSFRDVLNFDACTIAIGRKPIVLIHSRIIHQGAMNKGIYYSLESEHGTLSLVVAV